MKSDELIEELLDVLNEDLNSYKPIERYHDFRQVFLSTDQGRRVFNTIMRWGHMISTVIPPGQPMDEKRMLISAAERNFALKIFGAVFIEPPVQKPGVQERRNPNGRS